MIQNSKLKIQNSRQGFTLIEMMVALFIFSLLLVAIVSVFVATTTAYSKGRAIKTVKENAEFSLSSIAKDVRMGKIEESGDSVNIPQSTLTITRNRGGAVCYKISGSSLDVCDGSCGGCNSMVNISSANMAFDSPGSISGFRYQRTQPAADPTMRGWVEINLNMIPAGGASAIDMSTDAINVQTTVSSRDYGWSEVAP